MATPWDRTKHYRRIEYPSQDSPWLFWTFGVPSLSFAFTALVFAFAWRLPAEITFGYFYLLPIWIAFFSYRREVLFFSALICSVLIVFRLWSYQPDPDAEVTGMVIMNYFLNIGVLWFSALTGYFLRRLWWKSHISRKQEMVLIELGRQTAASGNIEGLLKWTHGALSEHFQSRFSKILKYESKEELVRLISGKGWDKEIADGWSESTSPRANTFSGFTLREGGSVVISNLPREKRFHPPELLLEHGIKSCINVLIPGKEGPYGILELDAPEKSKFSKDDVNFLESIARLLGNALDRFALINDLKEANRELEGFVSVASHDLKEPAFNIKFTLETLFQKENPFSDQAELDRKLTLIHKSTQGMLRLINNLLDYARSKKEFSTNQIVDLNPVAETVLTRFETRFHTEGIQIRKDALPTVYGNKEAIGQIMSNLIFNSVKILSGRENPEITLEKATSAAGLAGFSIKDNGPGMDEETVRLLFSSNPKKTNGDSLTGSGLGLKICQRIIERHKGEIIVESAQGKGSTIKVFLSPEVSKNKLNNSPLAAPSSGKT